MFPAVILHGRGMSWCCFGFLCGFTSRRLGRFDPMFSLPQGPSRQDTRICSVAKGERSYHIFFQLLQVLLGVFFVEADNQPELP